MTRANRQQDWSFGGLWPYEPCWFDTSVGRLHYIDEGPRQGRPVVLVHGNPTWGFLYRHFVGPLTAAWPSGDRARSPRLRPLGQAYFSGHVSGAGACGPAGRVA